MLEGVFLRAAIYSGSLKCAISIGAGAGASAKLGGTAQVTDMRGLVSGTVKPSLSAYKQFDLTYSSSPLTASFTSASGSLDATFFIDVILTLDSSIPITATAALHFATAMSAGSATVTAPSGTSGGGTSSSSGSACVASASTINGVFYGTLCFGTSSSCTTCSSAASCVCPPPVRRELQLRGQSPILLPWSRRLDSLATCPRTGTYFAASTQGLISVTAGPTDLRTLVTGVSAASGYALNSGVASWVPSTQLLASTTVVPPTTNGPLQPLVAACVAGGSTLSGSIGGPNAVALTSTGGGTNGGSSSSGGSSDSSSCGLGCVAAIVGEHI